MTVALTVRVDDEIGEALDRLATLTERSRETLVADAPRQYVELQTWQLERIREGLEAADRGDFASDDELDAIEAECLGVHLCERKSPGDAAAFDHLLKE
jgi:predicted transcriptional regulator